MCFIIILCQIRFYLNGHSQKQPRDLYLKIAQITGLINVSPSYFESVDTSPDSLYLELDGADAIEAACSAYQDHGVVTGIYVVVISQYLVVFTLYKLP